MGSLVYTKSGHGTEKDAQLSSISTWGAWDLKKKEELQPTTKSELDWSKKNLENHLGDVRWSKQLLSENKNQSHVTCLLWKRSIIAILLLLPISFFGCFYLSQKQKRGDRGDNETWSFFRMTLLRPKKLEVNLRWKMFVPKPNNSHLETHSSPSTITIRSQFLRTDWCELQSSISRKVTLQALKQLTFCKKVKLATPREHETPQKEHEALVTDCLKLVKQAQVQEAKNTRSHKCKWGGDLFPCQPEIDVNCAACEASKQGTEASQIRPTSRNGGKSELGNGAKKSMMQAKLAE